MKTTDKLPKRNNADSGKKAHNDNQYIKVGRIRMNSWATEVLSAYDIIIYESELIHIKNRHGKELQTIGMTAFDFVKFIISNYNEVRQGTKNTLLLCVHRPRTSNMAAIEVHQEMIEKHIVYKINSRSDRYEAAAS